MWLLALMILIMPFEASPYLYIAPNFLGVFPDFTVIKLLGLVGFAWAMMRLASGHPHGALLGSRLASLFLLFFFGVLFAGLVSGSGFLAISRYLAFLTFLPFVLVSVQTQQDLGRVLRAMALSLLIVFPYALRQMIRFNDRLGVGLYETNYFATILVLVIPLAFVFAAQATVPSRRWLWTSAGLLLVLELFLTSSRGGFLGLLVAGVVFLYRRRGLAGAVGVMAIMLLGLIIVPTDLGSRMWTVFVVFVMLIFAAFHILNRATRLGASPEGRDLAGWAEGLRSGLIGFLVAGFFISAQYEKMLWLAVFVTIVLGRFAAEVRAAELAAPAGDEGLVLAPVPEPS